MMKKLRFLIVILCLSVCLGICGKRDTKDRPVENREMLSESESYKEKNVVEDMSYSSLLLGGIEFAIPSCFGVMSESKSTDTNKYYYAEKAETPPMLMISYNELDSSQEEFDANKSKLVDGFFNSFENVEIKDTKDIFIEGLSGITVTATGYLSEIEMDIWVTYIYNIYEHKSVVIAFGQLPGTEYDYRTPYETIIQNAILKSEKVIPETVLSTESETSEFKQLLDDYEVFINEYVEFMKKYNNSTDTTAMLADYTDMVTRYSEFMAKVNDINTEELSPDDLAYYIEVTSRCSMKMLEAAQ